MMNLIEFNLIYCPLQFAEKNYNSINRSYVMNINGYYISLKT